MTCRQDTEEFLTKHLQLTPKQKPYLNRMTHGVDFLGCRVLPRNLTLNRRSRVRFRRRLVKLNQQFNEDHLDELQLQQRATALIAFTESAGAASWRFRDQVLKQVSVSGHKARTG